MDTWKAISLEQDGFNISLLTLDSTTRSALMKASDQKQRGSPAHPEGERDAAQERS